MALTCGNLAIQVEAGPKKSRLNCSDQLFGICLMADVRVLCMGLLSVLMLLCHSEQYCLKLSDNVCRYFTVTQQICTIVMLPFSIVPNCSHKKKS